MLRCYYDYAAVKWWETKLMSAVAGVVNVWSQCPTGHPRPYRAPYRCVLQQIQQDHQRGRGYLLCTVVGTQIGTYCGTAYMYLGTQCRRLFVASPSLLLQLPNSWQGMVLFVMEYILRHFCFCLSPSHRWSLSHLCAFQDYHLSITDC